MKQREVKDLVMYLRVGELLDIETPENLRLFRKYLNDVSKNLCRSFRTKIVGDRLHIMRVEYRKIMDVISNG